MKVIFKTAIVFGAVFLSIYSAAQNLPELEAKFNSLQERLQMREAKLDSLQKVLETEAEAIDSEKSAKNPDKDKLSRLMSGALTTSRRIEENNRAVSALQDSLERLKSVLDGQYARQIDSLQALVKSSKSEGELNRLKREILRLSEKRLLLSPAVKMLSFNPEKILQIHPAEAEDSLEAQIYIDYLKNALSDIDSHLETIRKTRQETEEILRLEEKKSEFLEDIAEDQYSGIWIAAESKSSRTLGTYSETPGGTISASDRQTAEISTISSQFQAYSNILRQLESENELKKNFNWTSPVDSAQIELTANDYINLLKEVEKQLTRYREIILTKLSR